MWPQKTSHKDTVSLALKLERGCFVFFHEMLSQVRPKRGQGEMQEKKVYSTHKSWRDSHCMHEGPYAGSTKGTDSASLVGELSEACRASHFTGVRWSTPGTRGFPGACECHQVTVRGRQKEDLWQGSQPYHMVLWSPGRGIHSLCVGMLRQQENTKFYKLLYSGPCGASTPMTLTRMDNPCHLSCGDVEGYRTAWFGPWRQVLVKVTTRKSPDRHTMRFRAHLHFVGENQKPKSGSSGLEILWKI